MTDAPNPRITRHLDSIESLASMLSAASQVGFRDVTVTTVKRRDRNGSPYTFYVLDLAERVEMRGESLPFPDSSITWNEVPA